MKAEEVKVLAAKAKEEKLNNHRANLLERVVAAAKNGNDSLVLGEWLGEADVDFFEALGYVIKDHTSPIYNVSGPNGTYITNGTIPVYRYSEISWA